MPTDNDFTKVLDWPGYRVYRDETDEGRKRLTLWIRRKRGHRKIACSGCGRKFGEFCDASERAVRELPWGRLQATVWVEVYRVKCPECGVKREKVLQLPSKAPFSKRFEEAIGEACESAPARQVARRCQLAASTGRAIDRRYWERWAEGRRKPALRQMGVDELYLGKKQKFVTVVSNLESGEPLWFGGERKKETWDVFFQGELWAGQRHGIEAACVDMWEPYRLSLEQWAPGCRIVYDKFHVLQHANAAIDEVRRAEFFRQGGRQRELVKGKRRLLLSRLLNLNTEKKRQLNQLFKLNRRVLKAYLLKESLGWLWEYRYEGAMLRYLQNWINQLRWQRLPPFDKLGQMLLDHLEGILNYCRTRIAMGLVEAINGNIRSLLRRSRGYQNLRYLLLKAQRMAATRTEFIASKKAA